jgi:hypothetical protein
MGFVAYHDPLRDGKVVGDVKGPRTSIVFQRFNEGGSSRFWRSTCASVRASDRTRVGANWHLEAIHSVKRDHEGAKSEAVSFLTKYLSLFLCLRVVLLHVYLVLAFQPEQPQQCVSPWIFCANLGG